MTSARQRLHQASFREAVITAYNGRCALSGLPEPLLLDAAHIVSDKHERLGQPVVPNGSPLSKIRHAAFDAHLIGIDPDYRPHVSKRLLNQKDGPMLEALKLLNGKTIHLPTATEIDPIATALRCASSVSRLHDAGICVRYLHNVSRCVLMVIVPKPAAYPVLTRTNGGFSQKARCA